MKTTTGFKTMSWMDRIVYLVMGYSLVTSIIYVQDLPLSMVAVLPLIGSYLALCSITGIGFTTFQQPTSQKHEEKSQAVQTSTMQFEDAVFKFK